MIRWPIANEYNSAVQNPRLNFADLEIQQSRPELTKLGIPRPRTGAFATVYKMQTNNGDFAVRCFLKHFDDQQVRYAAISNQLQAAKLPFTVGFKFIEKGILVNGEWYPVLRMDWVKGEPLNRYVERNLNNSKKLLDLAKQLIEMTHALHNQQIAHGDLQNGNILVASDRLVLIDYDGMYVPTLRGRQSHELGHRNFQHPQRTELKYDENLDNFSAWVIYTSLICLAVDPSLWTLSGADKNDEQMLFNKSDFENPTKSQVFHSLQNNSSNNIRQIINEFLAVSCMDLARVPRPSGFVLSNETVQPRPSWPSWIQQHKHIQGTVNPLAASPSAPTSPPHSVSVSTNSASSAQALWQSSVSAAQTSSTQIPPTKTKPQRTRADDIWDSWVNGTPPPPPIPSTSSSSTQSKPSPRTPADDIWDSWVNGTPAPPPPIRSTSSSSTKSKPPPRTPADDIWDSWVTPKTPAQSNTHTPAKACPFCQAPLVKTGTQWSCTKHPSGHPAGTKPITPQVTSQAVTAPKCPSCAAPLKRNFGGNSWQCTKYPNGHP